VRVLEDGRDPRSRGRSRSAWEVLSLRLTRVHEVDVGIDHARHHKKARCVDGLQTRDAGATGCGDAPAVDIDIGSGATTARDDRASLDAELMLHSDPTLPSGSSSWRTPRACPQQRAHPARPNLAHAGPAWLLPQLGVIVSPPDRGRATDLVSAAVCSFAGSVRAYVSQRPSSPRRRSRPCPLPLAGRGVTVLPACSRVEPES